MRSRRQRDINTPGLFRPIPKIANGEVKRWFENHPFMARVILRDASKIFENDSVVIYQRPDTLLR